MPPPRCPRERQRPPALRACLLLAAAVSSSDAVSTDALARTSSDALQSLRGAVDDAAADVLAAAADVGDDVGEGASGEDPPAASPAPDEAAPRWLVDAPERWLVAHHKTGFEFSRKLKDELHTQLNLTVRGPYTWYGQPFAPSPQLEALLIAKPCDPCLGKGAASLGGIPWDVAGARPALQAHDRLVNMIRDPFEMIISGYFYHAEGHEVSLLRFADGGERGGDLEKFNHSAVMARYGLPPSGTFVDYPAYLNSLPRKDALLAEMVRAATWDLPEMLASAAAAGRSASFLSVCLELLMGERETFDATMSAILDTLGVPPDAGFNSSALYGYTGVHSTRQLYSEREYAELIGYIRQHDEAYFGKKFQLASAKLPCYGTGWSAAGGSDGRRDLTE